MQRFVEGGELSDVDLIFAEQIGAWGDNGPFAASLMALSRAGHLCMTIDKNGITPPLSQELEQCVMASHTFCHETIVVDGTSYYLKRNWESETEIVTELRRIWESTPLAKRALQLEPSLTSEQKRAIIQSLTGPCTLIVGGPGTGKTFLVTHLVEAAADKNVVVGAPTGKAAARLKEVIKGQCEIGTIHALLSAQSMLRADLIVIDECSMIDAALFAKVLQAVPSNVPVVLIGDPFQLPPVEMGTIFADICGYVARERGENFVELKECMRSDRSLLLEVADAIKRGTFSEVAALLKEHELLVDPDVFTVEIDRFPLPSKNMPDKKVSSYALLSSMRKGPWGVNTMNAQIYREIALRADPDDYIPVPIIITKSDYRLDLRNGETGLLVKHRGDGVAYFGNREIPLAFLPRFEYAYCLSIHKSQGSEYKEVDVLLPKGSERFGREILYTGVTRAKEQARIIADIESLQSVVEVSMRKHCRLQERL